jgi:hypothetical protein
LVSVINFRCCPAVQVLLATSYANLDSFSSSGAVRLLPLLHTSDFCRWSMQFRSICPISAAATRESRTGAVQEHAVRASKGVTEGGGVGRPTGVSRDENGRVTEPAGGLS